MNQHSADRYPIDAGCGEVFTVELVDNNEWQSVFPSWLADYSQLHTSAADAWNYIDKTRAALSASTGEKR